MAIKVFISWSGELSGKLAEEIHNWLPNMLQAVKPYCTLTDMEKGVKWDSEISKELDASQIGLLCLTRDNMNSSWMSFEAGALSKKMDKSRVCPIFFSLEPTDLKGPLTSFQQTKFIKDDFKKLVSTINDSSEESKLQPSNLDKVFEKWWPELEEKIKDILVSQKKVPVKDPRTERDILIEILELTRMLAKPQRPWGIGHITARGFQTPAAFDPEQAASHAIFEKLAESQAAIAEELAKYSCAVGGKTSRESAEDHESSLSSENHLPDEKK